MKRGEVTEFWAPHRERIKTDIRIRQVLLNWHPDARWGIRVAEERAVEESLDALMEEAELGAELVQGPGPMLEVGAGLGLLHAVMLAKGMDVWALEASAPGFAGVGEAGRAILQIAGVKQERWREGEMNAVCGDFPKFRLIFSNNMLEHVQDLSGCIHSLASMLERGGRMCHHTVNYRIPYEPHFRILLFPPKPSLTPLFHPSLQKHPLWNGLQFLRPSQLQRLAHAHGLQFRLEPGMLAHTFARLETNPSFRSRHGAFLPAWKAMQRIGIGPLLQRIPAGWVTPMRVHLWREL